MSDEDSGISRRKALAAGGAIGAAALAGCAAEEGEGDGNTTDDGDSSSASPQPPVPPGEDPDNVYWQYVVDSLEFQNQVLANLQED